MFRFVLYTILLAIIAYPIADLLLKTRAFSSNVSLNDEQCSIMAKSEFDGLEDITVVFEDDAGVDLIGAFCERREQWLNPRTTFAVPNKFKTGLVHIRVDKKKCATQKAAQDCITVTQLLPKDHPFVAEHLKKKHQLFNPHGIFFDEQARKLYVISHAMSFGGDRVEVFAVDNTQKNKKLAVKHVQSLAFSAGAYPPANFSWNGFLEQGVSPRGSAYGVFNDLTIDRVNSRLVLTQWKGGPLSASFPRKTLTDKLFQVVSSLFATPTMLHSCPLESDVVEQDNNAPAAMKTFSTMSPQQHCVRSEQRYLIANGIVTNKHGDVIVVMDMVASKLSFERPNKLTSAQQLPTFTTLGSTVLKIATGDNIELHSDTDAEFCVTIGAIQRVWEPLLVQEDPTRTTSGGATKVCCPYKMHAARDGTRDVDAAACREEALVLSDGKNGRMHSGVSVAVALDKATWNGRSLVLTGSWYDSGMTVCWV